MGERQVSRQHSSGRTLVQWSGLVLSENSAPQALLILVRLFVSSLSGLDSSFCYLTTSFDASPQVIRWSGIYLCLMGERILGACVYAVGASSNHECCNKVAEEPVIPLLSKR